MPAPSQATGGPTNPAPRGLPPLTIEFDLDPGDLPRLMRWPGLIASRGFPFGIEWHDSPAATLASSDIALSRSASIWCAGPLRPGSTILPAAPCAEAGSAAMLGVNLPEGMAVQARFAGRRQAMRWDGAGMGLSVLVLKGRFLDGRIGNSTACGDACRIAISGPAEALPPFAIALAQEFGIQVPRWGLAEQALAASRGLLPAARAFGAPNVAPGQTVSDSLAAIIGHLLDVMVHWAALAPAARSPEPVHQMRVATRRLRSALSVYKPAVHCPALAGLSVPLKLCAARLGTARDWDVFIDGLGARLLETFPNDPRCAGMLRAAHRRRLQAYAELRTFLAGPDFRSLSVALACAAALRPWNDDVDGDATAIETVPSHGKSSHGTASPGGLSQDTSEFAATVLSKRMKRVRTAGRGMAHLTIPELHELRKDGKRLRYAAEFFAPLFPGRKARRLLQSLGELQEELGLLNDTAAVAGLMAQLGRLERSYAAGLVEGYSAAHAGPARGRIEQAWKRFRAMPAFWPH